MNVMTAALMILFYLIF